MSGVDPLASIALRPWPAPAKEALSKEDILHQTAQLTSQRGQFLRDITEKVLEEEVAAGKDGLKDEEEDEAQDANDKVPSIKERRDEINRMRHEVLVKLDWASFAAGNALNLVSLILSRDPAKYLENAFTPMFKSQNVPRGSVALAKENPPDASFRPEERERIATVAKRKALVMTGSRMEALDSAANGLLGAATLLEGEIRKEIRYWDEILSISEKGWSLQRTRRGERSAPYAVKYGHPEASPAFKARGVAPLRMAKDGGIILDPALALKPKTIRVRVSENGTVTGTSQLIMKNTISEFELEQSIQLARESLFEEELFHEMSIESRQLLAYGVELRNSTIHATLPGLGNQVADRKILIDCVAREDMMPLDTKERAQDRLAHRVTEALRLLLAHEHSMRLARRCQTPPPLTQHKKQELSTPLLRTLLSVFSHLDAVESLQAYLAAVTKTLNSAGLDVTLRTSREMTWSRLTDVLAKPPKNGLLPRQQLLASFIRPFEGTASLTLPSSLGSSTENFEISTATYIGLPHFGTEHKISLPPSLANALNLEQDQQRHLKFSSSEEVTSYLDWIVSLDLSQVLLFREFPGRSQIKTSDPSITITSRGSQKGLLKEDEVNVVLDNTVLKATATASVGQLATGTALESFAWTGSPGRPSLRDKVKSWFG